MSRANRPPHPNLYVIATCYTFLWGYETRFSNFAKAERGKRHARERLILLPICRPLKVLAMASNPGTQP